MQLLFDRLWCDLLIQSVRSSITVIGILDVLVITQIKILKFRCKVIDQNGINRLNSN